MESDITVGILAHNTEVPVLKETLASIRANSPTISIVLATNTSQEVLKRHYEQLALDVGAKFIGYIKNRGFGAGHNEIFKEVRTDWYLCCNPDIVVNGDTFKLLKTTALSRGCEGLITCRVLNRDGSTQPLARRHLKIHRWFYRQIWRVAPWLFKPYEVKFDYTKTQPVEFVSGCFFLVSSATFRRLGGFDDRFFIYCEDADLSKRAEQLGANLYVAEASVIHLWDKAWTKSWFALKHQVRSLIIYFNKHGWF